MSSSVLRNVIHPRQNSGTGVTPLTNNEIPKGQGNEDMEKVLGVLIENAPVAMAMFDQQMNYMLANRAWVEEFGLSGATPLFGQSQYEIFPNLHSGWRQVYERALQGHIIRSEHDALAGPDGSRIIYRWEVRPWRRQADATVGGLMITCERFGQNASAPDVAEEGEGEASPPEEAATDNVLENLAAPMITLDQLGRVQKANLEAKNICLARGFKEGETEFWEAFGDGSSSGLFKQQVLSALEALSDPAKPGSTIFTPPVSPPKSQALWGGTSDFSSSAPSSPRWLFSRISEGAEIRSFTALALPEEPTPRLPPSNLPAIATALASISQPPSAISSSGGLEVRRLQDDLARARQELRTLHDAERTFTQRESYLRQYLDSLPFGVLVLDELGAAQFQNQQLTRLLGRALQKEETVEQWLAAACPSDVHRDHIATLWREDVWRRQLTRTFTLATADGLLKDLEFQPSGLQSGGLLVSIQDATEKCRHEEQLRATEAKFRALLQEAPLPIVLMDKAGSVFEVNHLAEELLGHPKNELRRHPLDRWLTPQSASARAQALQELQLHNQRSTSLAVSITQDAAQPRTAQLHLAQVLDADGEPHCTIHFFETGKAQSSAIVVPAGQSPYQSSSSTQLSETQLFQTDVHGRIKTCSKRGRELLGLAEDEAFGRPLHLYFRPSDASGFYADLDLQAREPGKIAKLTCLSRGGARHSIRVKVRPMGHDGHDFSLYEVTETAAAHSPPLNSTGPLPLSVHAAAPSCSNKPLPTVNLAREKLLLSETHHRIKNHLQIISSLLNLESNNILDPNARGALRSSQNRVRSIADLHQHLYQVALGGGDDFCEFAQVLLQRLRECYGVPAERVQVHLLLNPGVVQQEWLMPLALTLNETLSNCFEHAFPGGRKGEVRVSLSYLGETGELTVTDNGIGLPESARPGGSSGLGLKILAVFAEQMRGRLMLNRPEQGGTEIRLRFPIASSDI
jgi:PAS domain S-box-containing protein